MEIVLRRVRVNVTCSDPAVAFAGEWPREESASAVLDHYRAKARDLGIPIQVAIEREGVWTIAPNGKAIAGALFDADKLEKPTPQKKGKRTKG